MTEVNCKIHEYLCNYVLPHFGYQSLIIGKDLIAVLYFSVIACNVLYFVASTFCNSAANLNEWVTPALNFVCNHLLTIQHLYNIIIYQNLEILKKQNGVSIIHIYIQSKSSNGSIIYILPRLALNIDLFITVSI